MDMNPLQKLLETGQPILLDGAMGTMLMEAGLEQGDPPEEWNVIHPDRIRAVHRSYIEAGSRVILTNSFGGTRFRLEMHNLHDRVIELNRAAAQNARAEADAAPDLVVVAGSMGPTGQLFEPMGILTFEEAKAAFAEQAQGLAEGGVDVFWVETMSDLNEVKAAVEGARLVSHRDDDVLRYTWPHYDGRQSGQSFGNIGRAECVRHRRQLRDGLR
jgi:methionine synthase I (cobalamin-dependent)